MTFLRYAVIIPLTSLFISCHSNHNKNDMDEHSHSKTTENTRYEMLFTIDPPAPAAGATIRFILIPVKYGTDSIVKLEIQHEKKIHFIVVSEDLSSFRHLHPAEQADGSFILTDSFQHGGNYILYADYQPTGTEKQVAVQKMKVTGAEEKPVDYGSARMQSKTNGYTVTLKTTSGSVISEKEQMLEADITKMDVSISPDELENYLGEKAHMVIISVTDKKYLHVHPMLMGGKLMLHTTFTELGIYRAWLEFKKDGKVNVADFVIKVD